MIFALYTDQEIDEVAITTGMYNIFPNTCIRMTIDQYAVHTGLYNILSSNSVVLILPITTFIAIHTRGDIQTID